MSEERRRSLEEAREEAVERLKKLSSETARALAKLLGVEAPKEEERRKAS